MQKSLRQRALNLLSSKEYSRHDLMQKLSLHSNNNEELACLLDDLAARNWQSDQRFAEQYARIKFTKYGVIRIVQELQTHGIDKEIIKEITNKHESIDDYQIAYQQWLKKFGKAPESQKELAKQIRFLALRGFNQQTIQKIVRNKNLESD